MSKEWNTGLFECTKHNPSLLDGCLCPCLQVGRQCNAVFEGKKDENSLQWCMLSFCLFPCLNCQIRSKVVDKYNIDEGTIGTSLKSLLCGPCSICQTHRELTRQNFYPGGFYVTQPYDG